MSVPQQVCNHFVVFTKESGDDGKTTACMTYSGPTQMSKYQCVRTPSCPVVSDHPAPVITSPAPPPIMPPAAHFLIKSVLVFA